ncbi:Por secretion system C-terminal sorting domain-containing protein [Chryseobacterium sp. RU37D]|uniref:T9SS type A sorting domain-containing protein n=1 Tax=Chryseobacterium sp. RU37D TaxID=1907397 RepID=UPI0009574EAD|nr:T9SS type A sorting domain-containing protein [Chryseobacterium sp. RU37D]SIQ96446.1 Por secretion system C-terminal sorting domain-containing protein [Chryseobacterium sp. RU37D]
MKFKSILPFLLLLFGLIHSQTVTIDLSTGKNDDGTLMSAPPPDVTNGVSVPDSDWSVVRPGETTPVTTRTRHTYTGWSNPTLGITGGTLQSRWITDVDGKGFEGDGYYYYYSKSFTIPTGVTDAKLNLRSLSFVRNWTYLVRTDITPNTEALITQTTWMSDGAKGWLNSRSPEVIDTPLTPGTYMIKVKLYTNSSIATNSLNVHSLVKYTPQNCSTPAPQVNSPVIYCQNAAASPLSATGTGLLWYTTATGGTGSTNAFIPFTDIPGSTDYWVSQVINGCESPRAKITAVVNPNASVTLNSNNATQNVEVNSPLTEIKYSLTGTTNVTVSSLPAGVTHTFTTNNEVKINGTPTTAGTYNYSITATGDCGTATANGTIIVTQTLDWTLAPNSYIFDIERDKNKKGLRIPVKKAYAMWKDNSNPDFSLNNPISTIVKAYVYWEDVSGLIMSTTDYELVVSGVGEDAEIEVPIDLTKGKGNALISLNALNTQTNEYEVKWSWHIWVTDNPIAGGSKFKQGYETDINNTPFDQIVNNGIPFSFQWMNRNLGATSYNFLGNESNHSSGLMYQWGRKDPIPPLTYKDASNYIIYGKAGSYKSTDFIRLDYTDNNRKMGWIFRNEIAGHNIVSNNIRYSINNPLKIISYEGWNGYDGVDYGTWFSEKEYKVNGIDIYDRISWDLWSDNRKGKYSNASAEDINIANDSKSYELKSPYDPCPNGWRIPSHYGGATTNNNHSPWGRLNSGINDGVSYFTYTDENSLLKDVRVYPQLGIDFTGQVNQNNPDLDRNLGLIPITGAYVFMGPYEKVDYNTHDLNKRYLSYINWRSTGDLPTATYSPYNGIKGFRFVTEHFRENSSNHVGLTGKYYISTVETSSTKGAGPCRCITDPNLKYIDNGTAFDNRYLEGNNTVTNVAILREWAKEPNSYVSYTNTSNADDRIVKIKLKKAIAMDMLYLSNNHAFRIGIKNTPSVVWTTDKTLITKMEIYPDPNNIDENSELRVTLAPNVIGNAVVAFHRGNSGQWFNGKLQDPIVWSWHIWVPRSAISDLPEYKTEEKNSTLEDNGMIAPNTSGHIINPTKSSVPPMKTIFMDRDLGALENLPLDIDTPNRSESNIKTHFAGGLHYQWGRKDPLPTFYFNGGTLYRCSSCTSAPNIIYSSPSYQVYSQIYALNTDGTIDNSKYSSGLTDAIFRSTDSTGYSREYNTYKQEAGLLTNDIHSEKVRKILKYSAENPFYFLFHNRSVDINPSQSPTEVDFQEIVYGENQPNYSTRNRTVANQQVKDWISDEREVMPERWGHNIEKSPFDPCPKGYRIPDTSMASVFEFYKGSSPWFYNKGLSNVTDYDLYGIRQNAIADLKGGVNNNTLSEYKYPGFMLANSSNVSYSNFDTSITTNQYFNTYWGWVFGFNGSKYNIGNIPTSGIRGALGGNGWITRSIAAPDNSTPSFVNSTGLWSSSLGDSNSGWAIAFTIQSPTANAIGKLSSGTGVYPQAAMSCRCAKIQYDANGNEIGRYDPEAIPVTSNSGKQATTIFAEKEVGQKVKSNNLVLYPNPVNDVLYIDAKDNKEYYYQIYNMSGQLVKTGKFDNKQTAVSSLSSGAYLVRINDSEAMVKIIKQ